MKDVLKTPIVNLGNFENNEMFAKIEGLNLYGSMKDRCAKYVIKKLFATGEINKDTLIIESSSGNMAVALAMICKKFGLKFCAVIDPSIAPINEFLIKQAGADIIKVEKPDENNSYLKSRLSIVNKMLNENNNSYWFNQYGNPLVREAYCNTLGKEIFEQMPDVDYLFMAVSSLGTIAGVCEAIKKHKSKTKIIAIDIEGSKIFDTNTHAKKHIPGIGSSIIGKHLEFINIDDNLIVPEKEILNGCLTLVSDFGLFVGGSSGACFEGAKKYLKLKQVENKKVLCVFADRGERYFDTIYNKEWQKCILKEEE